MPKFCKLRNFDNLGKNNITILNLMDTECEFCYDGKIYRPSGVYSGEYDFLLDYYVKGILPKYKIENDKIIPYLRVALSKESDNK